jgi:molybdate transport system regulatory protein
MNRFEARVESFRRGESYAWMKLGRGRLAVRLWEGIRKGQKVTLRVRPEDVLLCEEHPGRTSARNVLAGHVRSVRYVPEGAYVTMDVGFPLVALITRRARQELGLRKGRGIFALLKATAIEVDVGVRPKIRVSVVGPKGTISPDRIDLLRAIQKTGSISAAAREVGTTYRSAWNWSEEANRAWGGKLVARTQGGRGGGGARLTPEGASLLREVARRER